MWTIKLGGKTDQEMGILVLRDTQTDIASSTRDYTVVVRGRAGSYDFGAELEPKVFELSCAMIAGSSTELQQKKRELTAHLIAPDGKPRTLDLIWSDEPDKIYYVRYSGRAPVERVVNTELFTLPLVAFDPVAYGTERIAEIEGTETLIDVEGTAKTHPQLTLVLSNTTDELIITHEQTGKYVRIIQNFVNGDVVDIDCSRGLIKVNDTRAMTSLAIDSDFFALVPGINRIIVQPSGIASGTIRYRARWIG